MKRVVALPLVRATCTAVSGAYNSAKDRHPLLGSACRFAEHCVCSVATCALDHAQPLLEHLQPKCESESLLGLWSVSTIPRARCPSQAIHGCSPIISFENFSESGFCSVAQIGLRCSAILLLQPPECWDDGSAPPHSVYVVLGSNPHVVSPRRDSSWVLSRSLILSPLPFPTFGHNPCLLRSGHWLRALT